MNLTIVQKLSLSAVILVLLSSGIVGGLFYKKTTEVLVKHSLTMMADDIISTGRRLRSHIELQEKDVLFLAKTPPIGGMIRAKKSAGNYDQRGKSSYLQWVRRLQSIFTTLLESKRTYLKIRLIDENGQEQVVVGREAGKIVILKGKQLQNKSHRDYVRETLKLPTGSAYLSEISLNREHGKVSKPHREVLRSATPIYDEQLEKIAGLLLITVEIGHKLQKIQNTVQVEGRRIFISNDRGGYILHPDSSKKYGFDLGKRYRMQEDFPRLAKLFLPDNKDTNITLLPKDNDGKSVVNFIKIPFDPLRPERFIAVGITELYSNIVAKQSGVLDEVLRTSIVMAIIVMLIAILGSYRLSQPIKQITRVMDDYTNHRVSTVSMQVNQKDEIGMLARSYELLMAQVTEAQASLRDMNNTLETKVQERTVDLIKARDDAERANLAKSKFLSRMSHELRTPMNAILGFGQLLELDADKLDETQRSNVKEILFAGHHLLSLINEVLDLAKIESGKIKLSISEVSFDEVVSQCIVLVQAQADARRLELIDHISGSGYIVKADFIRIKQVLLNLLSNAVKYNREHGSIILEGEVCEEQRLRIRVTDTGEGLTEEDITKLFSSFERLNEKYNVEGAGIGLVITKHLVELMGGTIGVDSRPGEGSTFWVELDLAQAPPNATLKQNAKG